MRKSFVWLLILGSLGCNTVRVVDSPSAAYLEDRIEVGDRIDIVLKDQTRLEFYVTAMTATQLTGKVYGKAVTVPIEEIARISHRDASADKAFGTTVVVILTVLTVLVFVALLMAGPGLGS